MALAGPRLAAWEEQLRNQQPGLICSDNGRICVTKQSNVNKYISPSAQKSRSRNCPRGSGCEKYPFLPTKNQGEEKGQVKTGWGLCLTSPVNNSRCPKHPAAGAYCTGFLIWDKTFYLEGLFLRGHLQKCDIHSIKLLQQVLSAT